MLNRFDVLLQANGNFVCGHFVKSFASLTCLRTMIHDISVKILESFRMFWPEMLCKKSFHHSLKSLAVRLMAHSMMYQMKRISFLIHLHRRNLLFG